MEQLVEAYHNVAASPEFREMVRQRERAQHNEASALANAEQKGSLGERRKNIKLLYQAGFTAEVIAKALNLPEQEVKDILGVV